MSGTNIEDFSDVNDDIPEDEHDENKPSADVILFQKSVGVFGSTIQTVEKVLKTHAEKIEKTTSEEFTNKLTGIIQPKIDGYLKLSFRDNLAKWSVIVGLLLALTFWIGMRFGSSSALQDTKEISQAVQSSPALLRQVIENGNLSRTLDTYCHSGSQFVHQMSDGSTTCDMRVYLSQSGVAPSQGSVASPDGMAFMATQWLREWNPWFLLFAGFFVFITIRYAVSVMCDVPAIREFLALPKK